MERQIDRGPLERPGQEPVAFFKVVADGQTVYEGNGDWASWMAMYDAGRKGARLIERSVDGVVLTTSWLV